MALAVERAGATPLPELLPPSYLDRLLREAPVHHLATWDRHRLAWMHQIDRVLVLQPAARAYDAEADAPPDTARVAWRQAVGRLVEAEETRLLPYLLVAVPAGERSGAPGLSLKLLERHLLPALAAPVSTLQGEVERVMGALRGGARITLQTAAGAEWQASLAGRRWLADDGRIDEQDRRANAHIGNLPAGAVYTTVVEESATGELWLPEAAGACDVRLTFENGRIVDVAAREGQEHVQLLLATHSGDPDRVSHVGIGLNPALRDFVGWTLVDEHVSGAVLVALGENRYLGGRNQSDLNIDFALPRASLLVDDRLIVDRGRLVV